MRDESHTTWNSVPLRWLFGVAFAAASGFLLTAGDEKSPATALVITDGGSHAHHEMATASDHAEHLMSRDEFDRWVADFYATHPVRLGLAATAATDTFTLTGVVFDTDKNVATVVDTSTIYVGQNILWRLLDGLHTTTSGSGEADPQAGHLFDVPMPPSAEFSFTFTQPGNFPFFCRPHEFLNMRGVVQVLQVSDVGRVGSHTERTGFIDGPSPNPTHGLTAFHFSLLEAGHVRVEVFDARGRRLATPVDRDLDAGTYVASWDGRTQGGAAAAAGVYYLRLEALGQRETKRLVLMQ